MTPTFSGRRPRSMAEMAELEQRTFSMSDIVAAIQSYVPRPTDVVISPFGKCGTTWLQHTFHTLRTRGDADFDDISRVVPWIETARLLGIDLNAPQRAEPRGFKSHLGYDGLPQGARYVVSLRDPKDAFVSMYRFMEGWQFEPGSISYEDYFAARIGNRGQGPDYWTHLQSWWAQRDNPNVLLMSYEHMVDEPDLAITRLARFAGIALDDALLALTRERTSIGWMLAHKHLFDDAMLRERSETVGGLPPGSDSAKVRKGGRGGRTELPAAVSAGLDAIWASDIAPVTGHADYDSLEREIRRRAA